MQRKAVIYIRISSESQGEKAILLNSKQTVDLWQKKKD